ncbi:MAG: hypothetical protein PHC99_07735, partial [Methylococcales bacterium]|nr:hypothetical protein [Methylococcales bacterium]
MNIKKKLFFFLITLLMSLFLPNYVVAATTFSSLDTQGKLLNFANPVKVSGTGVVTNAKQGDVYKYTNVIMVDGVQVNAVVTITELVNMTTLVFDDPAPNPSGGGGRADGNSYTTSFGGVVPEAAIFAPQEWSADKTKEAYATFVISFQDTTGKPLVLKNVYNNSLDMESTEYNAYGGFSSYLVSADNKTNTAKHVIATPSGTNIRFSSSDCTGDNGLYIKDQSRVQAKFATISTLTIKLGQFANGKVPNDSGSYSSCTNSSQRYYGAIFVQDSFIDTPGTQIEVTAPTVNLLTTTNTTPTISGTIGGTVSTASPKGSALSGSDTFSVLVNGVTYTNTAPTLPSGKLVITGTTWSLQFLTPLAANTSTNLAYEVIATRNGVLVDQTNNELVITPTCVSPQVLNGTGTACVTPAASDTLWCHSGDGVSYSKSILASTDYSHVTHEFDQEAVGGKCPDEVLACVPPQILNAAGTACVTPVTSGTACTPITNPLTNIPADSDYDGKKITICHFPPGSTTGVNINTISVTAVDTHVSHHGDSIWESSKACPATTTSCDTPPTVNSPTTTDKIAASFSGNVGTSTTLTITIAGTSVSNVTITPVTKNGTWTYTAPVIAAGTYPVTVTGDGGTATGTLTVTASVNPTVQTKATTDKVAILLDGTAGSSSSLQIQIKNSAGAIQDSGTATIIGSTWTFMMPKALPAGTYSIVAIGDAAHGNLTGSGTLTVTSSVSPTVDKKTTTEKVAVPLTGSVGSSTSLTITVKDSTGITKATGTAIITGTTWTYTPIVLPAGTYDVTATGDTAHGSLVDDSKDELVVTAISPPTVVTQTTFDTTPIIEGTVGAVALETGEAFTVSVNGKTYTNGVDTNLVVTGTGWKLTILVDIPGSATAYPVVATRGSAPDTTTGTGQLTITPCALPKVVNSAKTACVDPVPTV